MAKSAKPKSDDEKQSQRFVETARKLETDESGKAFNLALEKIIPGKKSLRKRVKR